MDSCKDRRRFVELFKPKRDGGLQSLVLLCLDLYELTEEAKKSCSCWGCMVAELRRWRDMKMTVSCSIAPALPACEYIGGLRCPSTLFDHY